MVPEIEGGRMKNFYIVATCECYRLGDIILI